MKKRVFSLFGILTVMFVFVMMVGGCASYMALMDRTTPGWREMEPIKVFPDGGSSSGSSSSSSGSSSPSSGSSSSGGSSSSSSSSSVTQQPETITRSYTFDVPTSGQAGGGAAALARSQAVAEASERFRRENPGFEIRNSETSDGIGTLTVTITGRRIN